MLNELRGRLSDRDITLKIDDEAKHHIVKEGFDLVYEARPLKRFIQHHFETQLARRLVSGEIGDGATVRAELKGEELIFYIL